MTLMSFKGVTTSDARYLNASCVVTFM